MSAARMKAVGDAIWAVYNLRETWKSLGPRVETVKHAAAAPERNDVCSCGSGKKFKKCCG
ncbi:MAG: SEC-C domain-containing protein [Hydrogenophaga sp.]|nr:SEC-C domain-containing protein [Hydrogenophaga sp.]